MNEKQRALRHYEALAAEAEAAAETARRARIATAWLGSFDPGLACAHTLGSIAEDRMFVRANLIRAGLPIDSEGKAIVEAE